MENGGKKWEIQFIETLLNVQKGSVYIGVIGPVRTGKSTLSNGLWIPLSFRIWMDFEKERAIDEMPQQLQAEPL